MQQRGKHSSGVLGKLVKTLPWGFTSYLSVFQNKEMPITPPISELLWGSRRLLLKVGIHPCLV